MATVILVKGGISAATQINLSYSPLGATVCPYLIGYVVSRAHVSVSPRLLCPFCRFCRLMIMTNTQIDYGNNFIRIAFYQRKTFLSSTVTFVISILY